MHSKYSLMACMAFTLGVLSPASADVINTYSDLNSWENVSTNVTSTVFSGTSYGSSLSLSGLTLTTGADQDLQVIDTTGSPIWDYGTGLTLLVDGPNTEQPVVNIALPTGTTSFGLNLSTVNPYDDPLTVTVNGVSYSITSFSPTGGGFAFFGATFDAPITSFTIASTTGDILLADSISFGTSADTPEAATLLMIGAGLISMRIMNKRMHLFN